MSDCDGSGILAPSASNGRRLVICPTCGRTVAARDGIVGAHAGRDDPDMIDRIRRNLDAMRRSE